MSNILQFKEEFYQDIALDSVISEQYPEESFFDLVVEMLNGAGFLDDSEFAPYRDTPKGVRIDGYCWNELERVFCGIIVDLSDDKDELSTISKSEIELLGKRVSRFLSQASSTKFLSGLDPSSLGRSTGDFLSSIEDEIIKYRVIVLTDHVKSDRVKTISIDSIRDTPTQIEIWDLERLMDQTQASNETEDFSVDLSELKQPVQVIEASRQTNGTVTYIGVMPASVLSAIYGEFGQRLLESNVRTFLDFRAKPNQAMKHGLLLEPENFFSYNNGLTITASSAKINNIDGKLIVSSLDNMQVVNGGQTTATIYFTPKEKGGLDTESGKLLYRDVDLDKVSIQMKLTILDVNNPEFSNEYKAKISKAANFQSAVNATDLTSNSPFHKDMERLSRKVQMPIGNTGYTTKWFYERARGQYSTKKRGLKTAALNRFMLEYPKIQVFNKEALNKYEVTWQMQPHIVKKGTNPSRDFLMGQMDAKYEKDPAFRLEINYFQDIVSKMILFRQVDKAILKSDWYIIESGLKAEVVTYSIALVRKRLLDTGRDINLENIFRNQSISTKLCEVIVKAAGEIRKNIMDSQFRAGSGNVSEFCRNINGWMRIQMIAIDVSSLASPDILVGEKLEEAKLSREEVHEASSQMSDFEQIMNISATEWEKLASYNLKRYRLDDPQVKLPRMCSQLHRGGRVLTDKQQKFVIKIYKNSNDDGFEFGKMT